MEDTQVTASPLALAFNYPHYMATVYRAYHTRAEFAKYRIFTLHLTGLLALVAVASHAWPKRGNHLCVFVVAFSSGLGHARVQSLVRL